MAAFTGAESADDLLRLADQALSAAERNGRDRVEPAPQLATIRPGGLPSYPASGLLLRRLQFW